MRKRKTNKNPGSVFFLMLLVFISYMAKAQHTAISRPNVIILYADDLGYGDLSCYGATQIHTPNIDKLAAEGLRFTNGHCTAAICTPSRFSILTGEYAWRINNSGVLPGDASLMIPTDRMTLAKVFQKAGYHTACIGKWHLGLGPEGGPDWNHIIKPGPNEVGFDYSFIFPATPDRVPTIYVENHHVVGLDPDDPITVSYQHKVGNDPTGKDHPELEKMKSIPGQNHDGTIVNGIARMGWMAGGHEARWVDEELEYDFTNKAKTFIEQNHHHPFFLYFAMSDIHAPHMPAMSFKGESALGYRGDAILELDYAVGQIMETLHSLDLEKNTIVVFTSDNGPVLQEGYQDGGIKDAHGHKPAGPMRGGKYSILEGGTRIPLIVDWPGVIKPGHTSDALVSQIDFTASFAALLHVKLSKEDVPDSFNELAALSGKSGKGRNTYVEQGMSALALVDDSWKYIPPHKGPALIKWAQGISGKYMESGLSMQPQLYNLKNDIGEKDNLASKYPDKVKRMAALLQKIKESGHTRE